MRRSSRFFILIVITITLSGCYSLRKKFVRKRKSKEPQPVYVDFKEYPEESPEELYDNYYLFASAWMDEIVNGLGASYNYKRQHHAFNEVMHNLDKINSILTEKGRIKLKPIYDELAGLNEKVSPNMTDIDKNFILRRIEIIKLRFSRNFKHSKVFQWIRKN